MVPYTLLMIKPMSVGREDGAPILSAILDEAPVMLRKFRIWHICDTTWFALGQNKGIIPANLDYEIEKIHAVRTIPTWICVFVHKDRETDPTPALIDVCGPDDSSMWLSHHLRTRYSGLTHYVGKTAHSSDTVFHIAKPGRCEYEAKMLFTDFDQSTL